MHIQLCVNDEWHEFIEYCESTLSNRAGLGSIEEPRETAAGNQETIDVEQ